MIDIKPGKEFKEYFKQDFLQRCIGKYGRDPEKLGLNELYDVLGTVIRDYANIDGKNCKAITAEEGKKQF